MDYVGHTKHYQVCVLRNYTQECRNYCDSNMLSNIQKLRNEYSKNTRSSFYSLIDEALEGKIIRLEGNPFIKELKEELVPDVMFLCPTFTITKNMRYLDPKTRCFKDTEAIFTFNGITARRVYVSDDKFNFVYIVIDKIESLTCDLAGERAKLKKTCCPFIKEEIGEEGAISVYPYLGYLEAAAYNSPVNLEGIVFKESLNKTLTTLLYDMHLSNFNGIV